MNNVFEKLSQLYESAGITFENLESFKDTQVKCPARHKTGSVAEYTLAGKYIDLHTKQPMVVLKDRGNNISVFTFEVFKEYNQ
jgi:hypothetical protein